jgi:hypothetical protein
MILYPKLHRLDHIGFARSSRWIQLHIDEHRSILVLDTLRANPHFSFLVMVITFLSPIPVRLRSHTPVLMLGHNVVYYHACRLIAGQMFVFLEKLQ